MYDVRCHANNHQHPSISQRRRRRQNGRSTREMAIDHWRRGLHRWPPPLPVASIVLCFQRSCRSPALSVFQPCTRLIKIVVCCDCRPEYNSCLRRVMSLLESAIGRRQAGGLGVRTPQRRLVAFVVMVQIQRLCQGGGGRSRDHSDPTEFLDPL